jgi:dUTP pyrophosphatase
MRQVHIDFVKTHPNAQLPKSAHQEGDAGFDIYAVEDQVLEPGTVSVVRTGLQLAGTDMWSTGRPDKVVYRSEFEYYLDVRSRSGLSRKLVFPVTGTVDRNYRGEIGVVLANLGKEPYILKQGDRIAQLVVQLIVANGPHNRVVFSEVNTIKESNRGAGGFGSTGA